MAFSVDQPPDDLDKKTTLLMYFAKYMDEHLIQVCSRYDYIYIKIENKN